MSLGRDGVGACGGVADGRPSEQLQRRVVVDLLAVEHAAVAVRGVLAETDVGQQHEPRARLAQRPQRALDDAVVVPGARAVGVLLFRDAEQDQRLHAEPSGFLGLGDEIVDGKPAERGQLGVRLGGRADEDREHEVVEIQSRLAHERAQAIAAPEPTQPRDGKRAHINNLRASIRASPPKTAPSATSQSPSRSTLVPGARS